MFELKAEKRVAVGTAAIRSLRKAGKLPAVLYGAKEKATAIALSKRDFDKVFRQAGETSVVSISGIGEPKEALIYDVDTHPVTGVIRHVDFYAVEKGKKVEIEVPLEFVGVSPAMKDLGGGLVKVLHAIEIEVEPRNIPHSIAVDISSLVDFESQIFAKDIVLPAGATLVTKPDEVVALVAEAKEEVEEAPAAIDLSSIEVEKKGKEEEAAAEGAVPEEKQGKEGKKE